MRRWIPLCALALVLLAPAAYAWGPARHTTVAAIAFQELDAGTQQRLVALLRQHPDFRRGWQPGMMASGVPEGQYLLMRASVWPDEIRDNDHPSHREHRPTAHFINKLLIPAGQPQRQLRLPDDDVVKAITAHAQALRDPRTLPDRKAISLCWLAHLVGDIQQPLHTVALLSNDFPSGDRGGNDFKVREGNRNTNLHSYWDGQFGELRGFRPIETLATQLRDRFHRRDLPDLTRNRTPASWADESFEIARTAAYSFRDAGGRAVVLQPGTTDANARPLPNGYDQHARETSALRLALGGYRLTDVLKQVLPAP